MSVQPDRYYCVASVLTAARLPLPIRHFAEPRPLEMEPRGFPRRRSGVQTQVPCFSREQRACQKM